MYVTSLFVVYIVSINSKGVSDILLNLILSVELSLVGVVLVMSMSIK